MRLMTLQWSLAVFCGICLATFQLANSMDFISEKMTEDIEKLSSYFNVTGDRKLFGNSIFLKHLVKQDGNIEESEQKLLMHEILDLYVSILSNMMSRTKDSDVMTSIKHIKERVEQLRRHSFHDREHQLKKQLQDLWDLKTSDSVVQIKAVRELMPVFQKASELGIMIQKMGSHRRKREVTEKSEENLKI